MNYDALTKAYWTIQRDRVEQSREKIDARPLVGDGRKVPSDDSLIIGDGRRLTMAIMYIDICDFSSRASETQQEQGLLLKVLNLFFTEMIRISEEYNGVVEKNTGDGLMVYFNDNEGTPPTPGSKRAIACALTMLDCTNFLINPILKRSSVEEIIFRTSIDHGTVTIAKIGSAKRFKANTAIGTTANRTCKILKLAGKNEIVIGENAKSQLPIRWSTRWAVPCAEPSGWVYRSTGKHYPIYKYIGRWDKLG